jgi:prepilin-type N-terminal cleavage/methylation domain-containing protein
MKLPKQRRPGASNAFTLIEVMLAITIFSMAMFAILGVLASGVRAASLLRNNGPTAGMVVAQLSSTNKLEEGGSAGDFHEIPIYENYHWEANCREIATNGLFQMDVSVTDANGTQISTLNVLLYRPESRHRGH